MDNRSTHKPTHRVNLGQEVGFGKRLVDNVEHRECLQYEQHLIVSANHLKTSNVCAAADKMRLCGRRPKPSKRCMAQLPVKFHVQIAERPKSRWPRSRSWRGCCPGVGIRTKNSSHQATWTATEKSTAHTGHSELVGTVRWRAQTQGQTQRGSTHTTGISKVPNARVVSRYSGSSAFLRYERERREPHAGVNNTC